MTISLELKLNYLKRRENDLDILFSSLNNNNVAEFNRIGHQLAGNAASFGFDELEPIASQMESLSETNLSEKGSELLSAYIKWLKINQIKFMN